MVGKRAYFLRSSLMRSNVSAVETNVQSFLGRLCEFAIPSRNRVQTTTVDVFGLHLGVIVHGVRDIR
jgi:hypothetical protein